jgi:hypothetical protein
VAAVGAGMPADNQYQVAFLSQFERIFLSLTDIVADGIHYAQFGVFKER